MIVRTEKILPLPFAGGGWGEGFLAVSRDFTPPPSPLPQGEGENFLALRDLRVR